MINEVVNVTREELRLSGSVIMCYKPITDQQVTYYFYTRVVTLQLLTFTNNVCCLIINTLSFFCTCGLDSSLEVSDKLLYFSYKYNLTFSCFCKYLLFKIENMEVFIFFEFSDERIIFIVS